MGKRRATIENRVYIFTPLATELVRSLGEKATATSALREALSELARAACIVADSEGLEPDDVAGQIQGASAKKKKR